MATKVIESTYVPREIFKDFHARGQRSAVLVCHRRAGKTVAAIHDLVDKAIHCPLQRPQYAYVAPFYSQAKSVAWNYLKDATREIVVEPPRESELSVLIRSAASSTPAKIRLYGSDNPNALRGLYLDGVVIDETGQCSPRLFGEILRPALSDRKGWVVFLGTPAGPNHFYDLFRQARNDLDWFCAHWPVSKTKLIDEDELTAARRQMTEDEYEVEFEASFEAAVPGAIYAREMAKLPGHFDQIVPHDPTRAVLTGWDLGISDDTSIIFAQKRDTEYDLIDYIGVSGEGIETIIQMLRDKPYEYGEVFLPHDARARSLQTGRSLMEQMHAFGVRKMRIVPLMPVSHGIQIVRNLLPNIWISSECSELITALTLYQREYDPVKKVFRPAPRHDWTSHAADALRTLACGLHPRARFVEKISTKRNDPTPIGGRMTLQNLFEDRERGRKDSRI